MDHQCHALNCKTSVPPSLLMCRKHWWMVPQHLRARVWETYRKGQEIDKDPSTDYVKAAMAAVNAVADLESQRA